ncbi:hypothetical protein RRG08_019031 [Elysia crispata]|uniref:Uncharacterized protein n=1 Tax=Elysia crispata TaxID=231223 RepID=A0AAE1A5E1_9GAST|nr:hypothetical protein RRG08_019031 [Elysia crispata]
MYLSILLSLSFPLSQRRGVPPTEQWIAQSPVFMGDQKGSRPCQCLLHHSTSNSLAVTQGAERVRDVGRSMLQYTVSAASLYQEPSACETWADLCYNIQCLLHHSTSNSLAVTQGAERVRDMGRSMLQYTVSGGLSVRSVGHFSGV